MEKQTPYIIKGVPPKTVKSCAMDTQILLGNVKPRKTRKVELSPRANYHRDEDKLRTEIIKSLRRAFCFVFRLEPSTRGVWGVSDLLVFTRHNKMIFMEVKTEKGNLSKNQFGFSELCVLADQKYVVVTSVQQAIDIVKG